MKYKNRIIMTAIVITVLLLAFGNLFLMFKITRSIDNTLSAMDMLKKRITDVEDALQRIPKSNDGYTPIKGIDYTDGKKGDKGEAGRNGTDSKSTDTVEKETVIKEVPVNGKDGIDGKTIILRCNALRNRWETSYIGDTTWSVIRDTNNDPIRCIIGL